MLIGEFDDKYRCYRLQILFAPFRGDNIFFNLISCYIEAVLQSIILNHCDNIFPPKPNPTGRICPDDCQENQCGISD